MVSTTPEENDIYTSVLKISNIKQKDYGEYNCQVINNLGTIEARIRLQPKGPPEKPSKVSEMRVGHNYVTLNWEPGFNGGISNTKYFVSYKKVPSTDDILVEGCGTVSRSGDWLEVDCQQNVPCNVSHLDQHQSYVFKVKAINIKGNSENSQEIGISTRVDRIPLPQRVAYDPATHALSINVPATCLPLVAVVETLSSDNLPLTSWHVVDTLPLQVSGLTPTYKEAILNQMGSRNYKTMGRSLVDDEPIGVGEDFNTRVRVRLCLRTHHEHCGEYVEAERKLLLLS